MTWLGLYGKEIISLMIPFITWILGVYFRSRARLNLSRPHQFTFMIPEPLRNAQGDVIAPSQLVRTVSYILFNAGRETATKVELVFNWRPVVNVWPARVYEEVVQPDGRYAMIFGSLSPGETIGFELISVNAELPMLVIARSDQCQATNVEMYPQPIVKAWKRRLAMTLMFAGSVASLYLFIVLLQFLVLGTPFKH